MREEKIKIKIKIRENPIRFRKCSFAGKPVQAKRIEKVMKFLILRKRDVEINCYENFEETINMNTSELSIFFLLSIFLLLVKKEIFMLSTGNKTQERKSISNFLQVVCEFLKYTQHRRATKENYEEMKRSFDL